MVKTFCMYPSPLIGKFLFKFECKYSAFFADIG